MHTLLVGLIALSLIGHLPVHGLSASAQTDTPPTRPDASVLICSAALGVGAIVVAFEVVPPAVKRLDAPSGRRMWR